MAEEEEVVVTDVDELESLKDIDIDPLEVQKKILKL